MNLLSKFKYINIYKFVDRINCNKLKFSVVIKVSVIVYQRTVIFLCQSHENDLVTLL